MLLDRDLHLGRMAVKGRAAVHFTAFELSLRGVKKPDKRDGSFCQVFDVLSVDRRRDVRLFCSQGTVLFVRTLCAFTFLF